MGSIEFHCLQTNAGNVRKGKCHRATLIKSDSLVEFFGYFSKQMENFSIQYSAEELGGFGGGGEYDIQLGFGWSNGVIMQFLGEYGHDLQAAGSETHLACDKEKATP